MLYMGMADSLENFEKIDTDLKKLKTVGCDDQRGYEILGRAMGNNILATQEVSVAMKEWKNPSHEEFEERNFYSLYNSCTEAAKKTRAPGAVFQKYSGIHSFFCEDVEDAIVA